MLSAIPLAAESNETSHRDRRRCHPGKPRIRRETQRLAGSGEVRCRCHRLLWFSRIRKAPTVVPVGRRDLDGSYVGLRFHSIAQEIVEALTQACCIASNAPRTGGKLFYERNSFF